MFKIEGNNMYVTKGDAIDLTVNLTDATGTPITFVSGDAMTLTVKSTVDATDTVFTPLTATFSGVDAVFHSHGISANVGQYCAEIVYEHTDDSATDTYTVFPTWATNGDTRIMRGDITNWKNFWVLPKLRGD